MKHHSEHLFSLCVAGTLLLAILLFSGCAGPERSKGVYHRVQSNETLYQIARTYSTTPEAIARANNIDDVSRIEADRVLFIPGGIQPDRAVAGHRPSESPVPGITERPVETAATASAPPPAPRPSLREETLTPEPLPRDRTPQTGPAKAERTVESPPPAAEVPRPAASRDQPAGFTWPFQGNLSSRFGAQSDGIQTNGILLESDSRNPVVAAESGTVLHSAPIKFYGETVIVRHEDNYLTIYSQLDSRNVSTGARVSRGDLVGYPAINNDKGTYTLYFEMRRNNRPIDPLTRLPKR